MTRRSTEVVARWSTNVAAVAVVLAVLLAVAVVVAAVLAVRLRAVAAMVGVERTRADAAEAQVAAGADREEALTERNEELEAGRDAIRAELEGVRAERDRLQASVDDTSGELARLDDQLAELRADLANAQEAAREADAAAVTAVAQAHSTEAQLTDARTEVEQLRSDLEAARARPAPPPDAERPEASPVLVDGLWALERSRIERTWRQSVALDPSAAGPFDDDADPVRTAVEVEAAAVREEVGSVIEVDWRIDGRLGAADGLLVVRTAQELMVAGSRVVEDGSLVVEREGGVVVLALRGPGGEVVEADGLVVRVAVGA